MNQSLITNKRGAKLLANAASKTDDPQTHRMVAGAIANLCGNGKFSFKITTLNLLSSYLSLILCMLSPLSNMMQRLV